MVMASSLHATQQYGLASMAAWLSSTGISHHSLPCSHPLAVSCTVNSSSAAWGRLPQSPSSSSQPMCLPGDLRPCLGYVWLGKGLSAHSI